MKSDFNIQIKENLIDEIKKRFNNNVIFNYLINFLFTSKKYKKVENGFIFNIGKEFLLNFIFDICNNNKQNIDLEFFLLEKNNSNYIFLNMENDTILNTGDIIVDDLFIYILFLFNGHVTDIGDSKDNKLEISLKNFDADKIINFINNNNYFNFSIIEKNGTNYIYLKKYQYIVNFISFLNLHNISLSLESKAVEKNIINGIKKNENISILNIKKQSQYSKNFLLSYENFLLSPDNKKFKKEMINIWKLKYDNIDLSLDELKEMYPEKISKATIAN